MNDYEVHNEFFVVDGGHRVGLCTMPNDGLEFILLARTKGWTAAMNARLKDIAGQVSEAPEPYRVEDGDPRIEYRIVAKDRRVYLAAYRELLDWTIEHFSDEATEDAVRASYAGTTARIEKWARDE